MKPFKFLRRILPEATLEYYNTDEFECIGVTPPLYEPTSFNCFKYLLFRHRETFETIKGDKIEQTHPLWNYHE